MNLQRLSPDSELYKVYAKRIATYRKTPPNQDWDGVFDFQTK
jgi:adenylate cyclase